MTIMFFMIPLITWLWIIVGIFFVLGIGEGFIDVGCDVMLVWSHKHKVSSYLNGLHFFFGLGALLIPIFVALTLMAFGDVFYSFWILGLLVLPIAGWVLFLPSPEPINETRDLDQVKVNRIIVLMMSIFFVLYVGAEVSYGGWIFTYATSLGLGSGVSAAYLTSAFWGALTLGRLLMIPIAGRIRPMGAISIALTGCVVSLFLIFLNPSSIPYLWIGTVALGLSMGPIFPTMIAFSERRMALTGNIMRWFFVGAGLGGMFLPWLIGQLFETIGQDVTMYVILLDILLTIVVFFGVVLVSRPSRERHMQTKTY
jgi:FHS family Na+ dependent glucose MFS transporter 1